MALAGSGGGASHTAVVGTESQARMALGDKAVDGGAAPNRLRQGLDKGTVVTNGEGMELEPGQSSLTVRSHFIDGDAATEIAQRAKALLLKAGRAAEAIEDGDEDEAPDLLPDLLTAFGATSV
jgi:S-DNA-T family DNA segregation ATPase FtsK/SpoIIIE